MAPTFTKKDQNDDIIALEKYKGKKNVILNFYAKDFSPGCTSEACTLRDNSELFRTFNCVLVGVSSDKEETHKKFAEKYKLSFSIISDRDGRIRQAFKVPSKAFGLVPGRVTFVINQEGRIVKMFDDMLPRSRLREIVRLLPELHC